MTNDDQAAKEAAELLRNAGPCPTEHRGGGDEDWNLPTELTCTMCAVAAVAARLRQYQWRIDDWGKAHKAQEERIAALEVENERLRGFRDSHMMNCDCGLCVSERAALAGRSK